MEKHLILFDIDGTLLTDQRTILPATVKVVNQLTDLGHAVYIASGRLLVSASTYAAKLNNQVQTIASNGSVYTLNGTIVKNQLADAATKACFLACQKYPSVKMRLFSTTTAYCFGHVDEKLKKMAPEITFIDIASYEALKQKGVYITNGILFSENLTDLSRVKAYLSSYPLDLSSSNLYNIELIPKGRSKAQALLEVAENLQIQVKNTIAFGNGENDIEMLQTAGTGVAMQNSPQQVLDWADEIITSNNEDGIAQFLRHYFGL